MAHVSGSGSGKPIENKANALRRLLQLCGADPGNRPTLTQLLKEARAYGLRRADQAGGRDNLIYRLGYALDAIGWLGRNSHQLAGILSSSELVLEILDCHRAEAGNQSLLDLFDKALECAEISAWAETEGRRLEWQRLRDLKEAETTQFKASAAFHKPDWRKRPPTKGQIYLVERIVTLTGGENPKVKTRGAAFDFIDAAGGNPRFFETPSSSQRPRYR